MAGVTVLLVILVVIAINLYLRTFAYQVRLGKLTGAQFSVEGRPQFVLTDPKNLAQIRAALPGLRPGAGYPAYVHTHQSISLTLVDDHGSQVGLLLPVDESSEVVMHEPNDFDKGNSWEMPELLGVIGTIGMRSIAGKPNADPLAANQFRYWQEHFANRK